MEARIQQILRDREKRVLIQKHILEKFNMPLLVLRVNYPGIDKENDLSKGIIENMDFIISDIFQYDIEFKMLKVTSDGPIIFMAIRKPAAEIKKLAIQIEEKHFLGRCVDIDVYDEKGNAISRQELGYSMRKCFLCGDTAHLCVRSKKHSEREVIDFLRKKYEEYMENFHGTML